MPSFSPSLGLLLLCLTLPDLYGHCWGMTGASSNTIPITQGEEWPPFPLHSLSSPPGRLAHLFVLPDIRRHLNSPVTCRTMDRDETYSWRIGQRSSWHLSLPQFEDVCRAEVWLWVCRPQGQKPLPCNEVRKRDEARDLEDTDKVLSVCSVGLTAPLMVGCSSNRPPKCMIECFNLWICAQVWILYACYHIQ